METHESALRSAALRATGALMMLDGGSPEPLATARDRRRELHEAMVALEEAAAGPGSRDDAWRASVGACFERLAQAFRAHVEMDEGQGGLFHEILERDSRLTHRVDLLRTDHEAIADIIVTVREALASPAQTSGEVVDAILTLLGRLTHHRQAGADLVWEAYGIDIGRAN